MNREYVISDALFEEAMHILLNRACWIAYNTVPYFLEKGDMHFFKKQDEAHAFSQGEAGEGRDYKVIHAGSLSEFLQQISYGQINQFINSKNLTIMNENNYAYLKDNIKYMGFGEHQHDELAQHLKEGKDAFQMTFKTEVHKKPFEAVLQFRRPENSDMYFLNSYHASLERTNGEKMEQTFYLNKGKGVTAKEAYNLLEGRAVYKELTNKAGEPYKAWIQLDFDNKDKHNNHEVKQYHENYGYDLKAAVGKYTVKELEHPDQEASLLHSLQKGNIQSVTISANGTEHKMFLEANPQFKVATLYDSGMKRLQKEDLTPYQAVHPVNGKEIKQGTQEIKAEVKQGQKAAVKNKDDGDNSLLPKKRTRQKKGMKIS